MTIQLYFPGNIIFKNLFPSQISFGKQHYIKMLFIKRQR